MEKENLTREKIYENLKITKFADFTNKEINLILDYYLDDKITKETEELYKKVIKNSAKEFFRDLSYFDRGKVEKYEILNLVSFLSLAPLNKENILIESPIFKTLRAIPSITDIFLLYTKDSERNFGIIKEYLNKEGKEVTGKCVDIENINDSYEYLQELAKAGEIDGENTIMDSTSGLRMFGIALYKIAVERGINIVTWRDYQLPEYEKKDKGYLENKKNKRIPFLTKLTLLQEPKFENAKIYRALVKELRKFNFSGAMSYYNTLGLVDLKRLTEDFDEVFNLKNILELDSEKFYNSLEKMLNRILKYDVEEEKNKEVIKMVLLKLLSLVDYKNMALEINDFNIEVEDIDDYIEELKKVDKNIKVKIYYSFVIKYLEAKLGEEAINSTIIQKIIKDISIFNKKDIKPKNIKEISEELFSKYTVKAIDNCVLEKLEKEQMNRRKKIIEIKDKLEDIFEIADNLVDDTEAPIELNKNILKLIKYNLNIDLLSAERKEKKKFVFTKESNINGKIKHDNIAIPIVKLLNGEIDVLEVKALEEMYKSKKNLDDLNDNQKKEKEKKMKHTFYKNKSEIKKIVNFINKVVNMEIEKKGEEPKDLIEIKLNKNGKSLEKIYINEFFYK